MLTLSEAQLDILEALVPDHEPSPKGGRPPTNKRLALAGIFWVLDNGAKLEGSAEAIWLQEQRSPVVPSLGQSGSL